MRLFASSIVGGVNEHNSIVNSACADDGTAELAIIASKELHLKIYAFKLYSLYRPVKLLSDLHTASSTGSQPVSNKVERGRSK